MTTQPATSTTSFGTLCDYTTGDEIRPATQEEAERSEKAEREDPGATGAFRDDDGRIVFVAR